MRVFISVLIYIIIQTSLISGQNPVIEKGQNTQQSFWFDSPIHFQNINKIDRFVDKKLLKEIKQYEDKNDHQALLVALEKYVSNFGIRNFKMDDDMLWKLAQLYEGEGELEKAKWLYRMILKHSDRNIEFVRQYYKALTFNEQDSYVPIQYYYQLVDYRKNIDTLRPPRGVLINMGASVNSPYEDYAPTISHDGDMLIFTSKRNRIKAGDEEIVNEDLYWTKLDHNGKWGLAIPLDGINSQYNEGSSCLSPDGMTLYFVRCEAPDGYGNCDIYQARWKNGKWTDIENLGDAVNSKAWDSHPAVSHSGDTLYFASYREGGFGQTDIYFSVKDKRGKWQPAQNAGPVINTQGDDLSPFYHPKFNVLYFSSTGQYPNFGNFDIYKAYKVKGHWQEPKNIGPLVNGPGDEYYFTIDPSSKNLYYARSEAYDIHNLDLFSFPLPMEAHPEATTVFRGTFHDSITGNAFRGIVSIIDLDNGIEVAPKFIRPDGSFSFDLIDSNRYLLIIQGEDFFRIEKEFSLNGDTIFHLAAPSLNYLRVQFASIEFESGKAEILPEMIPDLEKLLDFLVDNPEFKLKISGHTDSQGNADINFRLSQQRADAIKQFLVDRGHIDPSRIEAKGYGSTMPIVKEEKTEEDRRINRRVEFEIIPPKQKQISTFGTW